MKLLKVTALAAALAFAACGGDKDEGAAGSDQTRATSDGARKLAVEVGKSGYSPDTLEAQAGEELVLEFTRVADTECGRYVKVADGDKVELPMNEPVEVAVTMPEDGELRFACGMDMMTGVVQVASK